jgi:hypothetical protein
VTYFYPPTCPAETAAEAPDDDISWYCTLDNGHQGTHEAHGAVPLPVWEDGGTVEYRDVDEDDE